MNNQYINNEQVLKATQGLNMCPSKVLITSDISIKEARNGLDVLIWAGNMHGYPSFLFGSAKWQCDTLYR